VGPLLADPTVHLVKATYDRALRSGETVLPAGGGRVTELVARPLLNVFWPELAGFVQPLSGEYAARRALLERLPFPTGYGVEVGLLVDALHEVGLDGLAQVDLTRRKHRNSSDAALGRMATEITRVVLARLQAEGRALLTGDICDALVQFSRDGQGYHVTVTDLTPHERPPVTSLASYTGGSGRLVP
jgi:glucosyl-3-phosphoglycerate synthase